MSEYWDTEELACYVLGKTEEETDAIINEPGKIDELLLDKYDGQVDHDLFHRIVMDLLPFTPVVHTALAECLVHAFVRTDKHGPCTIVRMDAEPPDGI